jgi:hypothetical protein
MSLEGIPSLSKKSTKKCLIYSKTMVEIKDENYMGKVGVDMVYSRIL